MKGIGFENMKVFKEYQWFDFKDITFLTGTNNSGKSSIINAMQMLQENIKASNIDELIMTEFTLKSNQAKYGSVSNFVNNNSTKPEDNFFVFVRQINNIKYKIKININSGLESYGNVEKISAFDIKENIEIFSIKVEQPYPSYLCNFRINYNYFINEFNRKCRNSEILRKRIVELDKLRDNVNNGTISIEDFKKFAKHVSEEVSVYIESSKMRSYSPSKKEEFESFEYYIKENQYINDNVPNIDEIGVFFIEGEEESGIRWTPRFINEDEYIKSFKNSYENGIFDFTFLWENNPEVEVEFKNLICSFYKKNYNKSYKMMCDDFIEFLSNCNWKIKEKYSQEDILLVPDKLTKTFIDSLSDFGLFGSMIKFRNTDESKESSYSFNNFLEVNCEVDKKSDTIKDLKEKNFFIEIYSKLSSLLLDYIQNDENNPRDVKLISAPVFNYINEEIIKKSVNFNIGFYNTAYVSTNRFTSQRAYTFNDNSDFTNFLKQVEDFRMNDIVKSKEFINKWIKEFRIADELLLKPDKDTGNFKAILRNGSYHTQLSDFGLGTNQLLPIIFALSIHKYGYINDVYEEEIIPRLVVIEEPESNLHPAMQSKLADMFVDANKKFKVQIIAETHSEYLIRRMQYLVANEHLNSKKDEISISNDKVNIYYINSEIGDEGRKAYEIKITKYGQLTESFGKGFFDETTNLQFELYKLNNAQFN